MKNYTRIYNKVLEELAKQKLNATQFRLILVIWRYTLGFNRKEHDLSISFLSNATGCDKRQIQRELKRLEKRKIIIQNIKSGSYRKISFNESVNEWIGETTDGESTNGKTTNGEITNATNGESTNGAIGESTTQEIQSLNTNSKKYKRRKQKVYDESSPYYQMSLRLFENIRRNNPNHKEPNFQKWADEFRKIKELDNRSEQDIYRLIDWCQQHHFWKGNILSPTSLRKHFDRLLIQSGNERRRNSVHDIPLERPKHWEEPKPMTAEELKRLKQLEAEMLF